MSYYQRSKFVLTTHALVRARQRLPHAQEKSDLIIECELLSFLAQIPSPELSDDFYDYYRLYQYPKLSIYVVVQRNKGLIVTVTNMNIDKQLRIYKTNR